jgi:hypothetical protein
MNEGTKGAGITGVATAAVEGLKNNPSCLTAILLAGVFAILTFYALQKDADRRSRTTDILIQRCLPDPEKK